MESLRRTRLTEADRALWASYASRVRPLAGRSRPAAAPAAPPTLAPSTPVKPTMNGRLSHAAFAPLTVGLQPGGVDNSTWQRFRTGRLRATRVLDLHGYTAQRAFLALTSFLRHAHAEGARCIEIVTGQGSVLRRELPLWLGRAELRGLVLAAAHPHAANPGSVRLLLRRTR